jgi:uncharacterized protein YoxC
MKWLIYLLLSIVVVGGLLIGGYYIGKRSTDRKLQSQLTALTDQNERLLCKVDSLLVLPAKVDTVFVHVQHIEYKVDTIYGSVVALSYKADTLRTIMDTMYVRSIEDRHILNQILNLSLRIWEKLQIK